MPESKLNFFEKVLTLLDKRFATAVGSGVTVGALVYGAIAIWVIPVYKERIEELKVESKKWETRYDNCPSELTRFQKSIDEMKKNSLNNIQIQTQYSEKLDELSREVNDLNPNVK